MVGVICSSIVANTNSDRLELGHIAGVLFDGTVDVENWKNHGGREVRVSIRTGRAPDVIFQLGERFIIYITWSDEKQASVIMYGNAVCVFGPELANLRTVLLS